jgi:glycosyltransferase involved in cell wall biosynthesis
MKVSVIIPAYNAAKTVCATVESVLCQTVKPHEILILDDGSTDQTLSLLNSYATKVTVFAESHAGLCQARNTLCKRATGDMIAMLDSDDVWHPRHLEMKYRCFSEFPAADLFFVGNENFYGYGAFDWDKNHQNWNDYCPESIDPLSFFKRYNRTPGCFYPSVCSFSRRLLQKLSDEPFRTAAEDAYFIYSALLTAATAVYLSTPLSAIRVIEGSLSSNRLKVYGGQMQAFELLAEEYENLSDANFVEAFRVGFAGARRQYAKRLMGAGKIAEGRDQLWQSLRNSCSPVSLTKSAGLIAASYMPSRLQPKWPSPQRELRQLV